MSQAHPLVVWRSYIKELNSGPSTRTFHWSSPSHLCPTLCWWGVCSTSPRSLQSRSPVLIHISKYISETSQQLLSVSLPFSPPLPSFFLIPLYAQPSLIPTFTFLYCPYPNSFDPPGSAAVDFQFWRGRFHCCDSWINGLFRLCGPPANGAGCWLLQHPSGGTLEVKG